MAQVLGHRDVFDSLRGSLTDALNKVRLRNHVLNVSE
jgi:hypothetical protein